MGRGAMFMLLGRKTTSSTKRRKINQGTNLKDNIKQNQELNSPPALGCAR
jgi:hypothetical protein